MLGDCLGVPGISVCIANDGSGFLSDSIVARFQNHNSRVGITPLSFDRCFSMFGNSHRRTVRRCVAFKKLPGVTAVRAGRRGVGCLRALFGGACVASVLRECGVGGRRRLRRLVGVLTSSVKKLVGPGGLMGAFGSMGGISVSPGAIDFCLKVLRRMFVIRGSVHCSVGKGGCVSAPTGCCFTSLNLHGTHVGFHRRRMDRLVRGLVCGRLHVHRLLMSINIIIMGAGGRRNGDRHGRLRISFMYGRKDGHYCVRSTLQLPGRRGQRRRLHSLVGVSSGFRGFMVARRPVGHCRGRGKMMFVGVCRFLLSGRYLEIWHYGRGRVLFEVFWGVACVGLGGWKWASS